MASDGGAAHRLPVDYLGKAQVMVAEPDDVRAQVEQAWNSVETSFQERAPGEATVLEPPQLLVSWGELQPLFARGTSIEELTSTTAAVIRRCTSHISRRRSSTAGFPTG